MKKNKIYVTTMYKFGDKECHSYIIYAGFSKHTAKETGTKEMNHRGNKYEPEIVEFTPGEIGISKTVYPRVE